MRRFLTALITFSILVMAQNVLAITPASVDFRAGEDSVAGLMQPASTDLFGHSGQPEPTSLALLLVGLAGLTAAGDARTNRRPKRSRA